jgi:hypothetical protein
MKRSLIVLSFLICGFSFSVAQNLKFGKPTDEEMTMTVYEDDKDAPAVVLCQLTTVGYTMDFYNYLVDYNVKTRIKVLKDEGREYANVSIIYIDNMDEQFAQENIEDFKAVAYNMENGKVKKTRIGMEKIYRMTGASPLTS